MKKEDYFMILMNNFQLEPADLRNAMSEAFNRVLNSGWYVLGEECERFELSWAQLCGVNHAVGVGNGMDAIEIALRSLDIGPGDEVITTPMTAYATVLAIYRVGAIPVLADTVPDTALLCMNSVKRCFSQKTKAIILVHLYGQARNLNEWVQFCESNKIFLIEDCAQAHLASIEGKVVGSFGDVGAYSFYPTKNLGALGDAGMLVTNNQLIAERSRQLRNYGQKVRYSHHEIGLNSRLDEVQAAILSVRLKWLSQFTQRRRAIAKLYRSGIHNEVVQHMATPLEDEAHSYHLFVIKSQYRDKLQDFLSHSEIQTYIHYPIPVHHQPPSNHIKRDPNGLTNSEMHAQTCISLPCHPQLSDQEVYRVINLVNEFRPY